MALGHDVHATEPDPKMLAILAKNLPDVRVSQATAEEIPSGDSSYDVVVSAQAFHWFDYDKALPEIARVLRPRGRLSLVWNQRDERIPWVKRLGQDHRHPGPPDRPGRGAREVEAVRRGRGGGVPVLADRRPALDPRPGPLPLQHRRSSRRPSRRPRWPRCSRSTRSTAGAGTACSCPTRPAASAARLLDRVDTDADRHRLDRGRSERSSPTAPRPTCCSSTFTRASTTGV